MATRVFDAQDALFAALAALNVPDAALAEWTVSYGLPARRQERHVWVDEQITEWTIEDMTTGLRSMQESFRLHVYVYVRKTGGTPLEVRDEAKAACEALEAVLDADPTLGGACMLALPAGGEVDSAFADPEGRSREMVQHLIVACSTFLS